MRDCGRCKNYKICKLEIKDRIEKCPFVYPMQEDESTVKGEYMTEFNITERTGPFTIEEVFSFIDDTNISKIDAHELKSRIADVIQAERNKVIDEAIETSAKAICVGCGYLDGYKCTYKGCNCGVSKPMLESVVKALEQLKGGAK